MMVDALPHVSFVSLSCALSPITAKNYGDIRFNSFFLQIQTNSAHHSPFACRFLNAFLYDPRSPAWS